MKKKILKSSRRESKEEDIPDILDSTSDDSVYQPPIPHDDGGWNMHSSRKKRDGSKFNRVNDEFKLEYYNPEVELPGDNMSLNSLWRVWIHDNDNPDWSLDSYKPIYDITSVGSMMRFMSTFECLDKSQRQFYIMRNKITPIWEDNANKNGAICSIMIDNLSKFSKNRGDIGVDTFSAICILVMNESFVKNNLDINGLCYSIKNRHCLFKLWIADYENNQDFTDKLPFDFLHFIDCKLNNIDARSYNRNNGRSKVSLQIKPIKPTY